MTFDALVASFRGPMRWDKDGSAWVYCSVHLDGAKRKRQSLHLAHPRRPPPCPVLSRDARKTEEVLARVGLSLADLFVTDTDRARRPASATAESPLPDYEAMWTRAQSGATVSRATSGRGGFRARCRRTVRLAPRRPYYRDRVQVATFDAMFARVQAPDGRVVALHQTYSPGRTTARRPSSPCAS